MPPSVLPTDMGQSDNPEELQACGTWRHDQGRDLLPTWWERVLAVAAMVLVVSLLFDVARYGL